MDKKSGFGIITGHTDLFDHLRSAHFDYII